MKVETRLVNRSELIRISDEMSRLSKHEQYKLKKNNILR